MEKLNSLDTQDNFDIKEVILGYLKYWPWFIVIPLITLIFSYIYLRYSTYSYRTTATILIEDQNSGGASELAKLEDFGVSSGSISKSEFENEIQILKSRRLLAEVVDTLNLRTTYFKNGKITSLELFGKTPIVVKSLNVLDSLETSSNHFYVRDINNSKFEISNDISTTGKIFNYGSRINFNNNYFQVERKSDFINDNNIYEVRVRPRSSAISSLKSQLKIQPTGQNSSVLELSITSPNSSKSESILNTLITVYNNDAIEDRNQVSKSTAKFIENRLAIITEELDSVEIGKVAFRERNNVTDIAAEGQLFLQDASEISKSQLEVELQLEILNELSSYLIGNNERELIIPNLGVVSGGSQKSIEIYNSLILEKNKLLKGATELNPVVVALSEEISELKSTILSSIEATKSSLKIENRDILAQRGSIRNKLSQIPNISKSNRAIERQQRIKEELYLYLLQKREETAISLAITSPKAKVVDYAHTLRGAIAPQKGNIYLGALALGLFLPLGVIYFINLIDNKVHNRTDVEKEVPSLPILGEVPTIENKQSETIEINDRSMLAESFRILRTNLSYFIKSKKTNKNNIIFVTSTVKGEGKTFIAYNLALTYLNSGKSVLLIGADIRNPQLHRYIDKNEWTMGLSEYLSDPEVHIDSITHNLKELDKKLDLVLSGRIPPNPAELLMNGRFDALIDEVGDSYDYIIVDTAPTLLVTDTLLISQKADITVYVCRAEYTDKKMLQYPKDLINEEKLNNVAFVINGVQIDNFGYGSKYGYGYGQEKGNLFTRIKQKMGMS